MRAFSSLLAAAVACAGIRPAHRAERGGIAGTVVDAAADEPVRFALLGIRGEDGRFHGALTDANGEFVLDSLDAGIHQFTVEHAAYQTATARVAVEPGRDTTVRVRLKSPDETSMDAVQIEPPVLLQGAAPGYSVEALQAHVEGSMIVRCSLTTLGTVTGCMVIRGLPHMGHVVRTLEQRRYRPAMRNGEPIEVGFTLTLNFTFPSEAEPDPAVH